MMLIDVNRSHPMQSETPLQRDSGFSYACQACRRCCHNKKIQINPYEIARLAISRDMSTGELIEQFLDAEVPYRK